MRSGVPCQRYIGSESSASEVSVVSIRQSFHQIQLLFPSLIDTGYRRSSS